MEGVGKMNSEWADRVHKKMSNITDTQLRYMLCYLIGRTSVLEGKAQEILEDSIDIFWKTAKGDKK